MSFFELRVTLNYVISPCKEKIKSFFSLKGRHEKGL